MSTEIPTALFDSLSHLQRHPDLSEDLPFPKDFLHAHDFLYAYRGSDATFNAYRREVERLLQWSWHIKKCSIKTLTRRDIEDFIEFCQHPPASWVGKHNTSRFIDVAGKRSNNPDWRPFVIAVGKSPSSALNKNNCYQLSQKALQAIFSVLSSFYNFLLQEDYVDTNPIAQIRQKSKFLRKTQSTSVVRRLSELQWSYVLTAAEALANKDPQYERTLFIMNALFAMYLRVSELVASKRWQPQMQHFYQDNDGSWWFETVGKGNKHRTIAVSDAMLKALRRYRLSLGLSALPAPGDNTPLVAKIRGPGPVTSTRYIRMLVQQCFDQSYQMMIVDGLEEEAQQLQVATVHWLRHTGISEDVKIRPREHVRDDAGHSSSAITDKYIGVELRQRHASSKNKPIKLDEKL